MGEVMFSLVSCILSISCPWAGILAVTPDLKLKIPF